MSVVKVEKTKNYTVMSNYHLMDRTLSLKAKGLLSVVLMLPSDWDYSIEGLCGILKEQYRAIKSTLDELSEHGYLKVEKLYPEKGIRSEIEYVYTFYEQPCQEKCFQVLQNVPLQDVDLQNQRQINTNNTSTNNTNTNNNINTKDKYYVDKEENLPKRSNFVKPTEDELNEYAESIKYQNFDAGQFLDYYESNGWKIGKNHMKDWKAAVRTWKRNDQKKSVKRNHNSLEDLPF